MTIPTDWPVGRLTMRSRPDGVPGSEMTADELASCVIAAARQLGFRDLSPLASEAMLSMEQEGRLVGTVTLDAGRSAALRRAADRALAWLNERAAPGRRFVMRDGLYQEASPEPRRSQDVAGRERSAVHARSLVRWMNSTGAARGLVDASGNVRRP